MDKNEITELQKKVKKQRRTIIFLTAYLVLSLFIQLYNLFAS